MFLHVCMFLLALIFLSLVSCGDSGDANYNSLLFVVAIRVGQRSGQLLALSSDIFVMEWENSWKQSYSSAVLVCFQGCLLTGSQKTWEDGSAKLHLINPAWLAWQGKPLVGDKLSLISNFMQMVLPPQRCKKRQALQARLCYFFSPAVLIFVLCTRQICLTWASNAGYRLYNK